MQSPIKRRRYIKIIHENRLVPEKNGGFHQHNVPDEITKHIFAFLKASEVVKAKLSCVTWYYASLPINYCDDHERKCSLESFIHFADDVEKIHINERELSKGFFTFISLFKNLRQIHLRKCIIQNGFFDLYQLRLFPRLRALGLWNSNVKSQDFSHIAHLKELRFIDLTGTRITNDNLKLLLESLPNLRQLCLAQCTSITPEAFDIKGTSPLQKVCLPFIGFEKEVFVSYKDRYPNILKSACNIDHSPFHVFNLVTPYPQMNFY